MRPNTFLVISVAWLISICFGFANPDPSALQTKDIQFESQILPIFKAHCVQCHSSMNSSGNLDLSSYDALMKSQTIVPKSIEKSSLIVRISSSSPRAQMPLGFAPLSASDISKISQWIQNGAKPGSGEKLVHWALQKLTKPSVPRLKNDHWSRNEIDKFVLDNLLKVKKKPASEANKATLIRRLYVDILGLLPSPQVVQSFLADKRGNAYEQLINRLLSSPHFGERMALPWLDAARYADSNGFQQDGDNYQYVWRDWVVNSFNNDMPFDVFTVKQLAGDLLPNPSTEDLIATGFNRNHMLNGEGGAIPEEQRNVILFDRVDVTSTNWLGLTMACARCHDHKYDPISQGDYYSFMAYFNNVPESGVPPGGGQYRVAEPFIAVKTAEETAQIKALQHRKISAEKALSNLLSSPSIAAELAKWVKTRREEYDVAIGSRPNFEPWTEHDSQKFSSFDSAFDSQFSIGAATAQQRKSLLNLRDGTVYPLSGDNTAFYFSRVIRCTSKSKSVFSFGSDDAITVRLNGKLILSKKVTRAAALDSELVTVELQPGSNLLELRVINGGGIGGFVFNHYPGSMRPAEIQAVLKEPNERSKQEVALLLDLFITQSQNPELNSLRSTIDSILGKLASIESNLPKVMVMSDSAPRKTFIYSRGDYESPTNQVQPNIPALFGVRNNWIQKNRLTLGQWITSAENPITSRVIVNRFWQMIFGTGLVRTPENFGLQGELPTHPKLLDWLASDFRTNGWKVKRLLKQIFMSATYRQTSKATSREIQSDPDNRYLARAPRFRPSSFFLRDFALCTSGLLNPKLGGKPVYPYQPKGIWDALAITKERDFTYPQSTGTDLYRRSLYTFWRRTMAPGNMFDASSRQTCTVRQSQSSTPLHALTMLNDVTWIECSRALAANSMSKSQGLDSQISEMFRSVCSRPATKTEVATLADTYRKVYRSFKKEPKSEKDFLAQGNYRANSILDRTKLAALTSVALVIYNLDEAINRE